MPMERMVTLVTDAFAQVFGLQARAATLEMLEAVTR
jgi:hypothetical protein